MHKKLKEGIYWVGAIDWNVREFHGYETRFGTTYNSYVVQGDKVALIDAVKEGFEDQLFNSLNHLGLEELDYLVVNHVEMDHAGALYKVLEEFPETTVVTSKRGKQGLIDGYGFEEDVKVLGTGDELDLGGKTLTFLEMPMVHWPDSMATYAVEDNVLMPNDAFGMHYASNKRFDDEFSEEELGRLFYEAAKYYANIVLLYSKQVQRVLDQISDLGLEFDIIAPSHGIIWRENVSEIVEKYKAWSSGEAEEKAVIIYSSMWGHTKKLLKQ